MDSKKSKFLWYGITTIIFLGLIYFADPKRFLESVLNAKLKYLLPAFIIGVLIMFVFAYTWHRFLKKVGLDSGYLYSVRLFAAGNFMNSITPLGQFGGEPFMAYIIKRNTDLSYEKAFSTVLSGDIVNGIPLISFMVLGTIYMILAGSFNSVIMQASIIAFLILGLAGPIVYLLWFKPGTVEEKLISFLKELTDIIGMGKSLVEKIEEKLKEVEDSFKIIGDDKPYLFKTILIAHLSILSSFIALNLILLSLGNAPDLVPVFFVLMLASLSNFAPTPGGAGAYEATMSGLLTLFLGIPLPTAITASILVRLTNYWPGILVGYACLLSLER